VAHFVLKMREISIDNIDKLAKLLGRNSALHCSECNIDMAALPAPGDMPQFIMMK
jgi:hypothetical protein